MDALMKKRLKIIIFLFACFAGLAMFEKQNIKQWFSGAKMGRAGIQEFVAQDNDDDIDTKSQIGNIAAVGQGMAYDYRRLVKLVKKAQQIKESFASQFIEEMSHKKRKHLDKSEIRNILSDLYRERVRLTRFTKELKLLRKGQLPIRQSRSLAYYDEVLEKYARSLEFILKQL